jgi:exosortase/archaeosortase family protein
LSNNKRLRIKEAARWIKVHRKPILLATLLLTSVLIIYGNDFAVLANEAVQNEVYSYILLLPFFAAFLCYIKKDAVKAALAIEKDCKKTSANYLNALEGVILCLMAFLVYWYGTWNSIYTIEYHIISLTIFLMGVTLIFLNARALRALILPILFLLFLIPLPLTILYTTGGIMANFDTQVAYAALKTAAVPVYISNSYGAPIIILSTAAGKPASFSVDIPCSGIYSLLAFAMFASFLAIITLSSAIKKLAVFIIGFFVFLFLNITRLIMVLSIAYGFGEQLAIIVHSFAGLILVFIGMLLVLTVSEKTLKIQIVTKPTQQEPCPKCKPANQTSQSFCHSCGRFLGKFNPSISKGTYAKALLLILCSSAAFVTISAPLFTEGQTSVELSSNSYQNATSIIPQIPNNTLTFLYRDSAYEKIADVDLCLLYQYSPENQSNPVVFVDVGVANTESELHSWEVCYITYETSQGKAPLVNEIETNQVQLQPPITAQYLAFQNPNGNYTQLTLYWFDRVMFKTGLTITLKYVRISLIILTNNPQNNPQYEQYLTQIGNLLTAKWAPMRAQALLSLGVPAQQALLAALAAILVATIMTQRISERRKTAHNLSMFNSFASHKERIVLQAVRDLAKQKKSLRTIDIAESVQNKVGKPVNPKHVYHILEFLEESGLVKRHLAPAGTSSAQEWSL